MNQPPTQPPDSQSRNYSPATVKTQMFGLDNNIAALLCYLPVCLVNLISSLVWLKTEPKENRFLRFHAMQGLIFCLAFIIIGVVGGTAAAMLAMIPIIGMLSMLWWGAWTLITVAFIVISVMQMISAYKGTMEKIYRIGDMAEERLGS